MAKLTRNLFITACLLSATAALADEVFRSTDGSKRVYARDRGDDRQALVDDTGKVIGYRTRTDDDGDWKYSKPDGTPAGSESDED